MFYYLKVKWRKWPQQTRRGWGRGWKVKDVLADKQRTATQKRTSRHYGGCNGKGKWKVENGKWQWEEQVLSRSLRTTDCGWFSEYSESSKLGIAPKKYQAEIERLKLSGQFLLMMV